MGLLLYALPFAATNAVDSLEISVGGAERNQYGGPRMAKVLPMLGATFGEAKVNVEVHEAYQARKRGLKVYNEVDVDGPIEMLLAFQFAAGIFPLGHIKSSKGDDREFLAHFKGSRKWLRCRQMTLA